MPETPISQTRPVLYTLLLLAVPAVLTAHCSVENASEHALSLYALAVSQQLTVL